MGSIDGIVYGFGVALAPANLLACFVGVLIGTVVGILPGIGPVGAMALLLPSTYALSPATALIMLAGIYYGTMYGGSTASIVVNVPGEAAAVVTAIDRYQMARRGGAHRVRRRLLLRWLRGRGGHRAVRVVAGRPRAWEPSCCSAPGCWARCAAGARSRSARSRAGSGDHEDHERAGDVGSAAIIHTDGVL